MSIFIDTNIPMYAAGREHVYRKPCQKLIKAIGEGKLSAVTDSEVFQEILYRYYHIKEMAFGYTVFDLFLSVMSGRIYPVGQAEITLALDLSERYGNLSPRDSIHLAVMKSKNINDILTTDRGFSQIEDIVTYDPRKFKI